MYKILNMEVLTMEQIISKYPEQWVLIGDPILNDPDVLGSIISKLQSGKVLFASKDKREVAYKAKEVKGGILHTACIYTGNIPQNRIFLL